MRNKDILIGSINALGLTHTQVMECLSYGSSSLSAEAVNELLKNEEELETLLASEEDVDCDIAIVDAFLNGMIIFKRGVAEPKPGQKKKKAVTPLSRKGINNIVLKKLKIALDLTNEDLVEVYSRVAIDISKGELTTFFRKEGHKHYKKCSDYYLIHLFNGIKVYYQ